MSKTSREVERNDQDWARSSGAKVQRSFPEHSATQPKDPPEFLGPTGGAERRERE